MNDERRTTWEGEAPAEPGARHRHGVDRLLSHLASTEVCRLPKKEQNRTRLGRSLALSLLAAVLLIRGFSESIHAAEPIEGRAYRVLVSVSFDGQAALSASARRLVVDQLRNGIEGSYGAMWRVEVVENDWLLPGSRLGLERLTFEGQPAVFDAAKYDKAFLLTVRGDPAQYTICGRQWDAATRTLGPIVEGETLVFRDAAATATDVVQRLFQPLLAVERAEGQQVILRMQAGQFSPVDIEVTQVRQGDVIRPFLRYLDDKLAVRRIQFLPWTYLIVEEIDGGRVKCTLVSGLRSPLGGSRRRSVEVMAVRVRPQSDSTQLRLVPRGDESKPLIGYGVDVIAKQQARDEPLAEPFQLVTDRRGLLDVPVVDESPLVWLYVRSGETLLSRVPFVPGIAAMETMELPDDSIRLGVEGETELLMVRLVDTVAKRAVHIARARILAREGDWKNVDKQLAAIKQLPVIKDFENELTLIRVPAVAAARKAGDRSAEANVLRICTRASDLMKRYLNDDPVRTLRTDIVELKKLDAEDKRLLKEE